MPASYATSLRTSGGALPWGPRGRVRGAHLGWRDQARQDGWCGQRRTSGGNIRVDSAAGALRAHTSGGDVITTRAGPLALDCTLGTSGGSVRVNVAPDAAFRLQASTSGGGVEFAGLRFESENQRGRCQGRVNGGGPLLAIRTSGGSISVRTEQGGAR